VCCHGGNLPPLYSESWLLPITANISFSRAPRSPTTISKEEMSATVRAVILAGGETKNPLTRFRAMPAVPLGSSLLMVDVPLNNCLNSGINKM
jgi:glucose-1-phosphate adenylyltransferase